MISQTAHLESSGSACQGAPSGPGALDNKRVCLLVSVRETALNRSESRCLLDKTMTRVLRGSVSVFCTNRADRIERSEAR